IFLSANVAHINRAVYATVKTEPTTTITSGAQLHTAPQKLGSPAIAPIACAWLRHAPQSTAACMTVSLATNPKNGGLPAMDDAAIAATHIRAGCVLCSPDYLLRSLVRSEEHTSELQSRFDLVCILLL